MTTFKKKCTGFIANKKNTFAGVFLLVGAPGLNISLPTVAQFENPRFSTLTSLTALLHRGTNVPLTPLFVRIPALRLRLHVTQKQHDRVLFLCYMSERRDSNPESLVPKTSMLAVTPRSDIKIVSPHDTKVF